MLLKQNHINAIEAATGSIKNAILDEIKNDFANNNLEKYKDQIRVGVTPGSDEHMNLVIYDFAMEFAVYLSDHADYSVRRILKQRR